MTIPTSASSASGYSPSSHAMPNVSGGEAAPEASTSRVRHLLIFLGLLALSLLLQWKIGAFGIEFSQHPDEPAHFLGGLLLHDYVAAGFPGSPLAYAKTYYDHYPYFGIGNWPPLFYVAESSWMFLVGHTHDAVILLESLMVTALAFSIFRAAREDAGEGLAFCAAVGILMLREIRVQLSTIGPDLMLAALLVFATITFARYLRDARRRDAVWFGVLSAAAILTKGNAWLLVPMAGLAILFTGRFDLLKRRDTWLAAAIVVLACGPWQVLTLRMSSAAFKYSAGWEFTSTAATHYAHSFAVRNLWWAALVIAAIVLLLGGRSLWRSSTSARVFTAFLLAAVIFHLIVPAAVDDRYLIPIYPALLVLLAGATRQLQLRFTSSATLGRLVPALVAVPLAASMIYASVTNYRKPFIFGTSLAADGIVGEPRWSDAKLLVSSQFYREGQLIAEIALRDTARPQRFVHRASKDLASSTWVGSDYKLLVSSTDDMQRRLDSIGIKLLAIDGSNPLRSLPAHQLLLELVRTHTAQWHLAGMYPDSALAPRRKYRFLVYERSAP